MDETWPNTRLQATARQCLCSISRPSRAPCLSRHVGIRATKVCARDVPRSSALRATKDQFMQDELELDFHNVSLSDPKPTATVFSDEIVPLRPHK